jgi:hypothetical protein
MVDANKRIFTEDSYVLKFGNTLGWNLRIPSYLQPALICFCSFTVEKIDV